MARGKGRREYDPLDAVLSDTASYAVRRSYTPLILPDLTPSYSLVEVEDNRRFHPLFAARPIRTISGRMAAVGRAPRRMVSRFHAPGLVSPSSWVGGDRAAFRAPARVTVCVRRQRRREVIMARGLGGGRHRRPRFNERSYISCGPR